MRLALAAAVAALTVSTASAADMDVLRPSISDQPATTRTIDWTGMQFGVTGGGDLTRADGSKFGNTTQDFPGAHVSLFAGYQEQLDSNFVLGLEGDVTYTGGNAKTLGRYDDTYTLLGTDKLSSDWSGSIRARVGYAFDNLLLYSTAGYVATRIVDKANTTVATGTFNEYFHGLTIGAGADYAFTQKLFGRAEYRYNKFFEKQIGSKEADLSQHVVSVGVGMKF
ncbi:outer membrane protein [Pleomorphomonas sp. NRK KF1]|uniref:outer membrane protein n=1 Tax=Pleomorphomonas sp. NRK KF1 TaxID=2943000 RepID=UPI0020432A66|nr:outer membrane protein [Pleomorphomonas sp. NRK KF1]MCM5554181.1 porin family protein [Pleomorphomonas sp. NRK KF1]